MTFSDIVGFLIKPTLQDIFRILSDMVVNKTLFRNYTDIKCIFGLVYFNDNSRLQSTIVDVLKEQADLLNQTMETSFLIIPDLPQLLLRPVIKQRSLSFKKFKVGILHQVYTGNYVISVTYTGLQKLKFSFSNQKMDEESSETDSCASFLLIKKGEKISETTMEKAFYFKSDKDIFPDRLTFGKV